MRRVIRAAFILALAAVLLLSGCGPAAPAKEPGPSDGEITPEETPALTEDAAADAAINPVFSLYCEVIPLYRAAWRGAVTGAAGDAAAAGLLLLMMSDEARLCGAFSAVGMLPPSEDGNGFSGSVTAPIPGEGRLHANGSFSFTGEDGLTLSGSYEDGVFTCSDGESEIVLAPLGDGFITAVTSAEGTGVTELTSSGLRYARIEGAGPYDPAAQGFPEDGSPVLVCSGSEIRVDE